ncbi:erythromycin resistance leader peptide [Corynebacterium glucuronolyticum]
MLISGTAFLRLRTKR